MVRAATASEPRFSVGVSEGGLFIEIARECRQHYSPTTRLLFLCGSDAAERIANWNYGHPGAFAEMLREFELLVAKRGAAYVPPEALRERIHTLVMESHWEQRSATEVREKIAGGEPWQHLVPPPIVSMVARIYGA